MLDIPSDEFHAHLFGGGDDYGISDAQGMALAEFPHVIPLPHRRLPGQRQRKSGYRKGIGWFHLPLFWRRRGFRFG